MLIELMRRDLLRTHRLQFYLIAYGVYRFLTEYIRPEPADLLGLTLYQWVSVLLVGGIAMQWALTAIQGASVAQVAPMPSGEISGAQLGPFS